MLASLATALLLDPPVWGREPSTEPHAERLAQNSPSRRIAAPLLIRQGTADSLITPASQAKFVETDQLDREVTTAVLDDDRIEVGRQDRHLSGEWSGMSQISHLPWTPCCAER